MNRVIITGGGGFVGRAILRLLCQQGFDCAVIGRGKYSDLEQQGVKCFRGDIGDRDFVIQHLAGYDTVFHVAAKAGIWGNIQEFWKANVEGTKNVIDGCLVNSIPVLVYTSTPSVVFAGNDIINGNETLPYPEKYLCNYAKTKAEAEKLVLAVDQSSLKTCAIRPHLVWGPGDPHFIPRLLERGRKNDLKIVGDGHNKVDITYIDNVAQAHMLAAKNLFSTFTAAGNAYFIGQERPVKVWEWINAVFEGVGISPVTQKISLSAARTVGFALESFHRVFLPAREPKMTRFLAEQLARSHYFTHQRAQQDFGYSPQITIEDGMEKLISWINK
ncbi:MAG: NAD-dependent epimerase/dehydratase family protein [Desulfopila sp.]|jgi:nucleoside-diphosphate-sugar epimerase|nr:NAD-dependent epimerase/dehydratase family protein [Desulfopila sp.]